MELVRFYLALIILAVLTAGILYWPMVHLPVGLWRRLGPRKSHRILLSIKLGIALAVFFFGDVLLQVVYPIQPGLIALGLIAYGINWYIYLEQRKQLSIKKTFGLDELEHEQEELVTQGIYSKVRHPRYLGAMFFSLAFALFLNYLALYVLFAATVIGFNLIARWEEDELRKRYADYGAYARRVPRFIPKLKRSRSL